MGWLAGAIWGKIFENKKRDLADFFKRVILIQLIGEKINNKLAMPHPKISNILRFPNMCFLSLVSVIFELFTILRFFTK
jgi:hypothetical protein